MSAFFQVCIGFAAIGASIFYGYGLFKDRKNGNRIDTVKLFKDQIDGMGLKINAQELDIQKLTSEVQLLKTEIMEKDKKLQELLDVLQGRDPALKSFIDNFEKEVLPVIRRLENFLNKQTF